MPWLNVPPQLARLGWALVCSITLVSPAFAECESDMKTYGDGIRCLQKKIDALTQAVEEVRKAPASATNGLPIGTIIASMLPPPKFALEVGDPASRDFATCKWWLADGSPSRGTRYYELTQNEKLPDLRGMFVRGLNWDKKRADGPLDPDKDRKAGDVQEDALQEHKHVDGGHAHSFNNQYGVAGAVQGPSVLVAGDKPPVAHSEVTSGKSNIEGVDTTKGDVRSAVETRPANVAVFYYVRIR